MSPLLPSFTPFACFAEPVMSGDTEKRCAKPVIGTGRGEAARLMVKRAM
jgi:hypothetical protein